MSQLLWRLLLWSWARRAKKEYGGPGDRGELFNTACFSCAVNSTTGFLPDGSLAAGWLREAGYVDGYGGCHWYGSQADAIRHHW